MLKLVRRNRTSLVACLALGLGWGTLAHGDENFWTKPSNSPARNDSNSTNWSGTPIGEQPKPNVFKRATSAMGSAATSVSSGVKGIFAKKEKPSESTEGVPPLSKPPAKEFDANFHVTLAQLQERTKNWAGAKEQYDKALKLDPNHLAALLGYGHMYDQQQKHNEALAWYLKACKRHPNEAAAFNDLGLCYSQLNRMSDAVMALEKATTLQPTKKLYRNNLATLLVKMNRPDEAYQQLTAVHPPAVAHYNIGYLLTQQNQRQLAYQYFCDALADDPNLAEAREWRDLLAPALAARPSAAPRREEVVAIPPAMVTPAPVSASTAPERALPGAPKPVSAVQAPQSTNLVTQSQPPVEPPQQPLPAAPENVDEMPEAPVAPSVAVAPPKPADAAPQLPAPALAAPAAVNDVADAPVPALPEAAPLPAPTPDRLAAPSPETIGTPSGGTIASQPARTTPRRAQRSGYVAPSRY